MIRGRRKHHEKTFVSGHYRVINKKQKHLLLFLTHEIGHSKIMKGIKFKQVFYNFNEKIAKKTTLLRKLNQIHKIEFRKNNDAISKLQTSTL